MKRKNTMKRCLILCAAIALMAVVMCMSVSADVVSGLQSIQTELNKGLKSVLDIVVNVLLVVGVIVLVFNLVSLWRKRGDGDNHSAQLVTLGITVGVMIILGAYKIWSPSMFTAGTGSEEAVTTSIRGWIR